MVNTFKQFFSIFLFSTLFTHYSHAEFITNLQFEWEDGNPAVYRQWGSLLPRISGRDRNRVYGGDAFLKTLILTGADGITRTIDAREDFIFPDVYKFNSPVSKKLYWSNTTGYYLCRDAQNTVPVINPVCNSDGIPLTWITTASTAWNTMARDAFSSPNLNFYVGGNNGSGANFASAATRNPNTVRHLLSYTNGVKVGFAGDGYVIVTERGGNNSFYLLARDMDGNELGDIYITRANNTHCSANTNPNSPYVAVGRMQENVQEICAAVAPIQDLAPPGSTIGSIEMWAASSDAGDGKVMLVHSLAAPDVCYDYSVRQNGHTIASKDRNFTSIGHGDLSISLGLKSMQSDYDMTQSRLKLDVPLSFDKAEYSPHGVNAYIPALHIFGSTIPEIAFGIDPTGGVNGGGTIRSLDRYFAKFTYDPAGHPNAIHFNFDLNITVDVSETQNNPIVYLLTTDANKYNAVNTPYRELKRCPTSEVYQPQWGIFNIERTNSSDFDPITQPNQRFPLYTQVSGKDFDFSLVSYDANTTVPFSEEKIISGTTIEVELIDISSFNDADAFFRCTDPNHDIITDIGTDSSIFVRFNNESRVDIADTTDLQTDNALRNAAFRMWLLVDNNGTLIQHNCAKSDEGCFTDVYDNFLASSDTTGACSPCSSYAGGCYQCLKDHFATPLCSRDNFSIRPASYRIQVSDTNESDDPLNDTVFISNNETETMVESLAAGYKYKIDANATLYGSDTRALGYHRDFKSYGSSDLVSHLSFQTTSGASCADTSNQDLETRFFDGKISGNIDDPTNGSSNNLHFASNVGEYNYHIEDLNWTKVDQDRFFTKDGAPLKTFPGSDDCSGMTNKVPNIGDPELYRVAEQVNDKHGCGISSVLSAGGQDYKDLHIRYKPYSFDVSDINMTLPNNNNFVYMNPEMSNPLYENMAVQFKGLIKAQGKDDIDLSNFTKGCAADDVNFDINFTTRRFTEAILLENIKTAGGTIPKHVPFRRNYKDIDGTLETYEHNTTALSSPVNVFSTQFENDRNGSAEVKLYYNFIPYAGNPSENAINPIQLNFVASHAKSDDAASIAHLITHHIPEGTETLVPQNIDFLYGRVTAGAPLYSIPVDQWTTNIQLYVEAYCEDDINNTCPSVHNLPTASNIAPSTYRINNRHTNPSDGQVEALEDPSNVLTISPNSFIDISTNPRNIQLTLPLSTARTHNATLNMTTPPWLFAEPIETRWLGGGGWAGTGKTGLILEINASNDETNTRTEW